VTPGAAVDQRPGLPGPIQTLLLRAILLSGDPATDAWDCWRGHRGDVRRALVGDDRIWIKRLLALLWDSVGHRRLPADRGLRTFLKMAYMAEAVRTDFCRRQGRAVLRELARDGLAPIVIRGFAFSETVYDEACLRHCHDIDLFLAEDGTRRAQATLSRLGFTVRGQTAADRVRLAHPSGWEVILHGTLFPADVDARLETDALERCEHRPIAGTPSRVLAPVDALLHACAHASCDAVLPSPMWICDLWFLLTRRRDDDWSAAAEMARRGHLEAALSRALRYLATALRAPIPVPLRSSEPVTSCRC
jgi:hypothetical protein